MSQPMSAAYLGAGMFGSPVNAALPPEGFAFSLSDDALEVVMSVGDATELDLVHATRLDIASPWQLDGDLAALNSPIIRDGFPHLDDARGDLYFERDSGTASEILVAHRTQCSQPFGAAVSVPGITGNPGDPSLTADGMTLAFSADSPSGGSDLYLATRAACGD